MRLHPYVDANGQRPHYLTLKAARRAERNLALWGLLRKRQVCPYIVRRATCRYGLLIDFFVCALETAIVTTHNPTRDETLRAHGITVVDVSGTDLPGALTMIRYALHT